MISVPDEVRAARIPVLLSSELNPVQGSRRGEPATPARSRALCRCIASARASLQTLGSGSEPHLRAGQLRITLFQAQLTWRSRERACRIVAGELARPTCGLPPTCRQSLTSSSRGVGLSRLFRVLAGAQPRGPPLQVTGVLSRCRGARRELPERREGSRPASLPVCSWRRVCRPLRADPSDRNNVSVARCAAL